MKNEGEGDIRQLLDLWFAQPKGQWWYLPKRED